MEEISYCTRESVQDALGYVDNPRLNRRIDSNIRAATREVEGFLHRAFLPMTATHAFDMPDTDILWLYDRELAAAPTLISSAGDTMTAGTDVILKPGSGPPYRWLQERTAGSVKFQAGDTYQNSIEITGDFGYPCRELDASNLADAITSAATTIEVLDSVAWGVGSLLVIGSERMLVTERAMVSTQATISGNLDANKGTVTVPVSDGDLISPGERIQIDSERMNVITVIGNTLTVERAAGGSVLAAHTSGATVYAPRQATVVRGMRGTTAASHDDVAAVSVLRPPSLIEELTCAIASVLTQQQSGGWARQQGSESNRAPEIGTGIAGLKEVAYTTFGRKVRTRAVA